MTLETLTPDDSLGQLVNEYQDWVDAQSLPWLSADELIFQELTPDQRAWVSGFIKRWDAVSNACDLLPRTVYVNSGEPLEPMTLAAFIKVNTTDGAVMSGEEIGDIIESLTRGEVYFGGGGAAGGWSISLTPGASDVPA